MSSRTICTAPFWIGCLVPAAMAAASGAYTSTEAAPAPSTRKPDPVAVYGPMPEPAAALPQRDAAPSPRTAAADPSNRAPLTDASSSATGPVVYRTTRTYAAYPYWYGGSHYGYAAYPWTWHVGVQYGYGGHRHHGHHRRHNGHHRRHSGRHRRHSGHHRRHYSHDRRHYGYIHGSYGYYGHHYASGYGSSLGVGIHLRF